MLCTFGGNGETLSTWLGFRIGLSVVVVIVGVMDDAWFGSVGHPVMAALEVVDDALDKTVGADMWSLSDDDLADAVARCERLAARQAELSLGLGGGGGRPGLG